MKTTFFLIFAALACDAANPQDEHSLNPPSECADLDEQLAGGVPNSGFYGYIVRGDASFKEAVCKFLRESDSISMYDELEVGDDLLFIFSTSVVIRNLPREGVWKRIAADSRCTYFVSHDGYWLEFAGGVWPKINHLWPSENSLIRNSIFVQVRRGEERTAKLENL